MTNSVCENIEPLFIAYLDGELEDSVQASVREHLDSCIACRAQYDAFQELTTALHLMGDAVQTNIPTIDIVAETVAAARELDKSENTVRLADRRPQRRVPAWKWVGMAAAAGLIFVLAFQGLVDFSSNSDPQMARVDTPVVEDGMSDTGDTISRKPVVPRITTELGGARQAEKVTKPAQEAPDELLAGNSEDIFDVLTLQDVLDVGRIDTVQGEGLSRLARAALTPQKAAELGRKPGTSIDAIIGAAPFMDLGDRISRLRTVTSNIPDNSHAQFALARAYTEEVKANPESPLIKNLGPQISSLINLDPENSLLYFMDARRLLEAGQLNEALDALQAGTAIGNIDTYVIADMIAAEEAMLAAGVDADAARVLNALTAGDYQFLAELGTDLIAIGAEYETEGDYETARSIYEAVQTFGGLLGESSTLTNEQLAALDLQTAAIERLQEVYIALGLPEQLEELNDDAEEIETGYNDLQAYIDAINSLLAGNYTEGIIQFANAIFSGIQATIRQFAD